MLRIPVESSDIVAIGYDDDSLVLEVEFQGNRVYQYRNIPPEIHAQFLNADSHGQYFNAFINGQYRYDRLEATKASLPESLAFVTGSSRKYREFSSVLGSFDIRTEQLDLPIDEIQSESSEEIAIKKAKHAYRLAGRPVVAHDTFWNILALHGFPGGYMSYVTKWLQAEDFLRLMDGKTERAVCCTETVVYYDGKRSKVFTKDYWGTLAHEPKGKGLSIEQIFVQDGRTETSAELENDGTRPIVELEASLWYEFAKWFRLQRRIGRG